MALNSPFEPVHLLFMNLLTDSLPALAIGMEPSDRGLLREKPKDPKTGILTKEFCIRLLRYGLLIAIVTQTAFYRGLAVDHMTAETMAFATLTLARLFHGFTCRSDRSILRIGIRSNLWSVGAFAAGVLLLAAVLLVPAMHGLFAVTPLDASQLGTIVLLAVIPTVCIQLTRVVREHLGKK